MEGAAAGFKELADSYKELLKEEKAKHAATKEELKAERAAHAVTKAELDQLKAASAKRPAEAAASPPATKQRTSEDAPPPGPSSGGGANRTGQNFTAEENERYLALLNQYGQPVKKNAPAWAAFGQAFPDRSEQSWAARVGVFNKSEYDDWRKANGGAFVGFAWRRIK